MYLLFFAKLFNLYFHLYAAIISICCHGKALAERLEYPHCSEHEVMAGNCKAGLLTTYSVFSCLILLTENPHKSLKYFIFFFMLKVIILARESGLKLELSDIPIENLVPEPLRVRTNFDALFTDHKFAVDTDIPIIGCRLVLLQRNLCKIYLNLMRIWLETDGMPRMQGK